MHSFKTERVTEYVTGVGMSEQGISPGFPNIYKVKKKKERELQAFRFFLNWYKRGRGASNII